MKLSLFSGMECIELIQLLFQLDVSPVYKYSSSAGGAAEKYCHLTSRYPRTSGKLSCTRLLSYRARIPTKVLWLLFYQGHIES